MLKQILDVVLNETIIDRFFCFLLWVGPVIGLVIGSLSGLIRKRVFKHASAGLLIGFTGTLISVMWYVYNLIMDHFGLDSVAGLLLNLLLFVLVGMVAGLIFRWFFRRPNSETMRTDSANSNDGAE